MRSFIKTHRRGSSTNIGDGSLPDLNTSTSTTDLASEERHNGSLSANSSNQSSPIRQSPSSPIVNKSKKLHRLFQRNKTSSQNLFNLSSPLSPISPKKSPPPSIIGTRTHEWGNNSNDLSKALNTNSGRKLASRSSQSSANSFLSEDEQHQLSTTSTSSRDPFNSSTHISGENESIQLPLNTVLEIPNEQFLGPLMREIPTSTDMDKKNRHRRAQIISTDSFKLEDPPEIIPIAELQKQKEVSTPEMFNDGFIDPDETVAETILNEKIRQKRESQNDPNSKENNNEENNKENASDYESDGVSEFSFEQDNKQGRNVSIRYYKSPAEDLEERQMHNVKEQGSYVNDLIDDNFDEDLNYYDEYDDDYNDDEEIFNKKYFSDEEDDIKPVKKTVDKVEDEGPKITPQNSMNIHPIGNQPVQVEVEVNNKSQDGEEGQESQEDYYDDYDDEDFDDGFGDDEEVFNKKYFSDEEEEPKPKKLLSEEREEGNKPTSEDSLLDKVSKAETSAAKDVEQKENDVEDDTGDEDEDEDNSAARDMFSSLINPSATTSVYPSHKNGSFHGSHLQLNETKSKPFDDLLAPRRSLKYHQISTSLDQDVPQNRYSWLSEDDDIHNHVDGINSSFSYESLLDEINNIPEDLDFGHEKTEKLPSRSKSMNSSMKRNKGVFEDSPQNTKFESNNKTVTLFNRPSRQNSVKSNNSAEFKGNSDFGYLTPNGSFTLPNPMFANNQNNELSPITEGSIDGSP